MRRVTVVGGGLAGISAALRCADAGWDVTLLESKPRLGGLTHSFRRGGLDVDNGQHVFLRCCTAYLGLLDRLGVRDQVHMQPRLQLEVRRPGHARSAWLRRDPLPAPAHLIRSLITYSALRPADRVRVVRGALALRGLDRTAPSADGQTFGAWLADHGQNARTVDALWDLLTVATLNAHADDASLALAAMVFQVGLFSAADAGDIGYATVPLQQLHGDAAAAALAAAGATVSTNVKVQAVQADGDEWVVTVRDGTELRSDRVILAVPPVATQLLLPPDSLIQADGWAEGLSASPIVNVHVVFDRTVLRSPFAAGVGSSVQWVFDRTHQSGLTDGQYLAISLSAATDLIDVPTAEVRARILPALLELVPAARAAEVRDFFVTREREATFFPAPGTAALRPGPHTRHPGLAIAGAWTATGWPATMESAVLSGNAAAASVLRPLVASSTRGSVAA